MFDVENSWLFLDASGLTARVGIWRNACWQAWRESDAGALEALHAGVAAGLAEAKTTWGSLGGYIYVEGPGSVLGLRLAAMAIRAWQVDDAQRTGGPARPAWACGSLHLAAAVALAGGAAAPFAVFTDARHGHWNLLKVESADTAALAAGAVAEVGENDLPGGILYHLPARKAWARAPKHARPLPASLKEKPEVLLIPGLLRPVETAVPSDRALEYKKWKA